MGQERKHDSPNGKLTILYKHLFEKMPVSQVCKEHGVSPNVLYRREKEFSENESAAAPAEHQPHAAGKREMEKIDSLWRNVRKHTMFFILIIAFVVRMYNVRSPILGPGTWRQADTAAMARNFYENGYRVFYPQIDWGGETAGYVESEFPIYSFAVALLYRFFGVSEVAARMLSIVLSLLTIYFLYLLVSACADRATAGWSCLFLSILPLAAYYSRTIQPESALLLCSVAGVYYLCRWIDTLQWRYFSLSAVLVALACLIKIPTLYLGLPILYVFWLRFGKGILRQRTFWLYGVLVLLPTCLWYYHAHRIFLWSGLTFRIWEYGTDKWGNWSLPVSWDFWDRILYENLIKSHLTKIGFLLVSVGLFLKRQSRLENLFDFWMIACIVYILIVARGNYVHKYYQLPLLIPCVVFMAKVYARYFRFDILTRTVPARHILLTLLLALSFVSLSYSAVRQYHSYMHKYDQEQFRLLELAQQVKVRTEQSALLVTVDEGNPTLLYHAGRKGWHASPGQIEEVFLAEKAARGAKYVVGQHKDFEDMPHNLRALLSEPDQVVLDNAGLFIVRISK